MSAPITAALVRASGAPSRFPKGSKISKVLRKLQSGRPTTIGYIGDSIIEGNTVTVPGVLPSATYTGAAITSEDMASIMCNSLAQRFGTTVTKINRANSGRTVQRCFTSDFPTARLDAADLWVIGFGHNDIPSDVAQQPQAGYPLRQSIDGVRAIVRRLLVENPWADVIIMGTAPYDASATSSNARLLAYNRELRALADEIGLLYVDNYTSIASIANYSATHITAAHPNTLGHAVMAQTMLAEFPTIDVADFTAGIGYPNTVPSVVPPPFTPGRFDDRGWRTVNSVTTTPGTDRIRGVAGSGPWTFTSTNGVDLYFTGSEASIILTCGAGQGVCNVYDDGFPLYMGLNLATLGSGTERIVLPVTVPRLRTLKVEWVSGSVTIQGFEYARGGGVHYWPDTSARVTYGGSPTSEVNGGFYSGNRTYTSSVSFTAAFDFVGTGCSMFVLRGIGGIQTQTVIPTIDGVARSGIQFGTSAVAASYGGVVIASGLPYGRHSVSLAFDREAGGGSFQIGGFCSFDEDRLERPRVQGGCAKVGETVLFGTPWSCVPRLTFVTPYGSNGAPFYATNLSPTGFTLAGGAVGDVAQWEAVGNTIAF